MSKVLILLASAALLLCASCKMPFGSKKLETMNQKLSYAIGMEMGNQLKEAKSYIDPKAFMEGFQATLNGTKTQMTPAEAQSVEREMFGRIQKEISEKNAKEADKFLATNKSKPGVMTTASGLQWEVVTPGSGPKPLPTDRVKVHYRGTLTDGSEFDNSYTRGQPAVFPVNAVIPGWSEALQLMNVGGKYKLAIPSALAYGDRGAPPKIGPGATLLFDVELISIEK